MTHVEGQIHCLVAEALYYLCVCFSFCLLSNNPPPPPNTQFPLIGQHTPSTTNNKRAAVLNQFVCAQVAGGSKLCKCVTW